MTRSARVLALVRVARRSTIGVTIAAHKDADANRERDQRPQLPELTKNRFGYQFEIRQEADHADSDQHGGAEPTPSPAIRPIHDNLPRVQNFWPKRNPIVLG